MLLNLIVFIWGFAEATLFFIVPDVLISMVAIQGIREGLLACLYALGGAITGGVIMYYWGRADVEAVNKLMDRIPAIRWKDIQQVQSGLHKSGIFAVLLGPLLGIPYKIYAANSHSVMSVIAFMLISIPARVVRFILIALLASQLSNSLLAGLSYENKMLVIIGLWVVAYGIYFFVKRERPVNPPASGNIVQ